MDEHLVLYTSRIVKDQNKNRTRRSEIKKNNKTSKTSDKEKFGNFLNIVGN